MDAKHCLLLAPPGVWGDQQAATLADRWQVPQIDFPALLDMATAQETAIGVEVQSYWNQGQPVPDPVLLTLLRRRLEQPDAMLQGWVLTGFPRTSTQAAGFNQWWQGLGQPPATVVYLTAMRGILINRLFNASKQTAAISVIKTRLDKHEAEVEPILAYYQQQDQLTTINASVSFAEVAQALAELGQAHLGAARLIQDEAELDALIADRAELVVDCMAAWCGSCKQVAPLIDQLAEDYGDRVAVRKLDFDANRQISQRFGLKGIPAVLYFKQGALLDIITGVQPYHTYRDRLTQLLG